jgi:hypothetical protein
LTCIKQLTLNTLHFIVFHFVHEINPSFSTDIGFILYLFAKQTIQKNNIVKKDLFSQKFSALATLLGFSDVHSVAGIQPIEKDDPPTSVPPAK